MRVLASIAGDIPVPVIRRGDAVIFITAAPVVAARRLIAHAVARAGRLVALITLVALIMLIPLIT